VICLVGLIPLAKMTETVVAAKAPLMEKEDS
jgi:hypothetical protein